MQKCLGLSDMTHFFVSIIHYRIIVHLFFATAESFFCDENEFQRGGTIKKLKIFAAKNILNLRK